MRLGVVTGRITKNDGQGRVNREIVEEALRRGHDVTLFCEHVDNEIGGSPGVHTVGAPPPAWLPTRLLRDQLFALRTYAQIGFERNRCDAVLANGFVTWARSDINAIHFLHHAWARSNWHPWRVNRTARSLYTLGFNYLNTALERNALKKTRRIVAVSDKIRCELLQIGVRDDQVVTIFNGVDAAEFRPGVSERQRFGLPERVPIGLFAGDMKTSRKNLDTVMRALAIVPGLHLAVAGHSEGTPYPALAWSTGIGERVHFLGFQRDMPALMRSVDLLIFPSRYEGFSLVFLEALASGLPVVTARSAGGAEVITSDVGVVLDNSEDHAALAATLRPLLERETVRAAMSVQARLKALDHSWSAMAARYVDLMTEAATRNMSMKGRR